jgi:hypothetical protein
LSLKINSQRLGRFMAFESTRWGKTIIRFLRQVVRLLSVLMRLVVVDGLQDEIPDRWISEKAIKDRFHVEWIHSSIFQPVSTQMNKIPK